MTENSSAVNSSGKSKKKASAPQYDNSLGSVRQSQLLHNYGPGAIVDLVSGSYMPMGLETQELRRRMIRSGFIDLEIREERLSRLLEVETFWKPPAPSENELMNFGKLVKRAWGIPTIRFPEWLECPSCHRLGKIDDPFEVKTDGSIVCNACERNVAPVRFIVICPKGHIEDFPWYKWAHQDLENGVKKGQKHILKLLSHGESAALSDLFITCEGCGCSKSLGEIFLPGSLKRIGFKCHGRRPWLGSRSNEQCSESEGLRVVQRGGSNVYFPVMASMLSIPPASEALTQLLAPNWQLISRLTEDELPIILRRFTDELGIKIDVALAWVKRYRELLDGDQVEDEASARYEEYLALSQDNDEESIAGQNGQFQSRLIPVSPEIADWFKNFTAVERLREVRALCGFSRINPVSVPIEGIRDALDRRKITWISETRTSWFPGVEIKGEGIFFKLDIEAIREWERKNPEVQKRVNEFQVAHDSLCKIRGDDRPYTITASLLLIHSLAHALIRRLSLDCGYSSASLRERLYFSEPDDPNEMAGILIYTGSPDSDGSLGGLIGLAETDRLSNIVLRAIQDTEWCANDPVCSEVSNLDERLSGAACHACLLLPETSCERYNRDLDRVMLVGSKDNQIKGFFDLLL